MTAMQIVFAVSVLGGAVGGMGMGGGTLLIPLLTVAAGIEQHLAQAINLIAFLPMSAVALAIHRKNGYVDIRGGLPVTVLALAGAVGGSFAAGYSRGYVLRACYGAFLIALGCVQLFVAVRNFVKSRKQKARADEKTGRGLGCTEKVRGEAPKADLRVENGAKRRSE